MKLSILCLLITSLIPHLVCATEESESTLQETHSQEQLLSEAKLEKIQAETMAETLIQSGRFSKDEGERAFRSIASVHEEDLDTN